MELTIDFLLTTGQLWRWALVGWRGLVWDGRGRGNTTQRGNTQLQLHKHIFLITTVSHGAVCKDRRCCTSGGCNTWRVTFQSFNEAWVKDWGSWSRIWSKGKDFIVRFLYTFFFYDKQTRLRTVLPSLPDSLGWSSCQLRNWKYVGVLQETVKSTQNPWLQKRLAFL